jgi:PQQ-like domain
MNRGLFLIAFLAIASSSHAALSADQAAKFSWLQQLVGTVTDASFADQLVHVISKQGVLAALSQADGSVAWRRVLAPGSTLVPAGPQVLALEAGRALAFDASSGALIWELPAVRASAVPVAGGRIVIAAQDSVQVHRAGWKNGGWRWQAAAAAGFLLSTAA